MTFAALILLLACAGIGYYFWKTAHQDGQKQSNDRESFKGYPKDELRIENVGPGAVIHLTGIGADIEDFDLKIIAKHRYRQGESNWYELECDKGSEKVWIDMEEGDDLELAITLRKLTLREVGVSKKDLERMDDDEEGNFDYEGNKYYLEDSDSAVFCRYSDEKNAEKLYYWDFEDESGQKFIGIERWGDGSYDVSHSETVKPSQVTVYSLG